MTSTFVGMPKFPVAAKAALEDTQLRRNLAHATATIRDKRARVVAEVDNWEELRLAGAAIKDAALFSLDTQLVLLEERRIEKSDPADPVGDYRANGALTVGGATLEVAF